MMISFLYPYPSIRGECGNSIQDLHIERIIRYFTGDDKKQKYILGVLSTFENNVQIIYYRQHLFQDLFKFPKFYDSLCAGYKKLEKLYEDHRTFKLQYANIKNTYEASQALINDLIKDFCYMLTELMFVYRDLSLALEKYKFTSEVLKRLEAFINEKYNNQAFNELYTLLDDIILNSSSYDMEVMIDKGLKICNNTLLLSKSNHGFLKRNKDLLVPINIKTHNIFRNIYNDSRMNLFKMLDDIYYGLMNPLFDCHEELVFLEFAIKLYDIANRLKMEITYPTFIEGQMEYENLYDIY